MHHENENEDECPYCNTYELFIELAQEIDAKEAFLHALDYFVANYVEPEVETSYYEGYKTSIDVLFDMVGAYKNMIENAIDNNEETNLN